MTTTYTCSEIVSLIDTYGAINIGLDSYEQSYTLNQNNTEVVEPGLLRILGDDIEVVIEPHDIKTIEPVTDE